MSLSSTASADASGAEPFWVESAGGPLVVVPVSALTAWRGCTQSGATAGDATAVDDYDRACAVADLAGVVAIGQGGAQALVLADEPAPTCFLPEHRAFLRRLAADSAAALRTAAEAVLTDPAARWEECGTWLSDGPAVLMDAAAAGTGPGAGHSRSGTPAPARVPLPAGRWRVRATRTTADAENQLGLVQLLPAEA